MATMLTPATITEAPAPADRRLALVAAVERLAAARTLDDVIAVVRETARGICGAQGVTFVLRDGELCHYVDENAIGPLWKGRRFPLSACISGWCMLNRQAAVISDIYADPRIPHDAYRPTFVKSLIMTPVGAEDPRAAIGAYWDRPSAFDEEEIALLRALARSSAAALAALQAREAQRESDQRLAHALDAASLGAWELDLASGRLGLSPLGCAIFGCTGQAAVSLAQLTAALHTEDRSRLDAALAEAQARRRDVDLELRAPRADGVRWIELRGRAQQDVNGDVVRIAGICADVTERRLARERIDSLQEALARFGRVVELDHASSALAHELRQPLSAAKTYLATATYLLGAAGPELHELMAKADAELGRVDQIIRRIRGFIGGGAFARSPEDVEGLVREALAVARVNPLANDVDLELAIEADLPRVEVDRVQVQQVLLNLLRNGFEAVAPKLRKWVRVSACARSDAGAVELSVEDNGGGLSPEAAARLFAPFVSSKPDGMGVGLSICKQIVERHGGRLRGENAAAGAVFSFTLPRAAEG